MLINTFSPKTILLLGLIALACFGCASSYKRVVVSGVTYHGAPKLVSDTLRVSYQYNVQETSRNRFYSANERRYGVAAVAIRIENISAVPITITHDNFRIYSTGTEKNILSPASYSKKVRQRGGLQMLHALWGPYVGGYYLPFGLAVGVYNVIRAAHANEACAKTMEIYEIWNRTIDPGKTLDGLVTLQAYAEEPLSFSYGSPRRAPVDSTSASDQNVVLKTKVISATYDFFVIPVSGSSYNVTTRIYTDGLTSHIVVNDPTKGPMPVYPIDTKSLSRITKDGKQFLGIPHDNYWLFKTLSGNINAYHIFAEEDKSEITHIQKGNGPIVKLTPWSIHQMIDTDPELRIMLSRGQYYEAIVLYNAKRR